MVDIVIVNWNSGTFLEKCLRSVFMGNKDDIINKVFVIDNNSIDSSLAVIPNNEKIVIVKNTENVGFSKACNQGFRLCTAKFVLLLNPDAQIFESTLEDCVAFMNQRPDVDILGCQLLDDNGRVTKSCTRFPTALRMCFDAIGLSKVAPTIFTPATIMMDWDHSESRFVDQVMGAFMFMRISIFEKAGYFDERFFVYFEELDFSKRFSLLGGKSYYNTAIKALHSGKGTTTSVKDFSLFLNLQSRLQYAKKHFSAGGYWVVWFSTFFIEPISRALLLLVRGDFKGIRNVFKAYKLLIASLPVK